MILSLLSLGLAVLAAYLIGSFPTGILVARLAGWRDPRERDSGHTGALNSYREGGPLAFLIVAVIDILKGVLAVALAGFISSHFWAVPLAGAAAIAGHNWPVYTRFRGGMGLSTAAGAVGSHCIPIVLAGMVLWVLLNALIRHPQRAMALTMLAIPPGLLLARVPNQIVWLGVLCAAVVFIRHLADWNRRYTNV